MKNLKRIISFMMAMIIFASFFCYNIGAVDVSTVLYPRNNTYVREFFSDTSAYAFVRIRDWAEEENTTDLIASTYAHVNDYEDLPYFYDAISYVALNVHLSDGSEVDIYDQNSSDPDEGTVDASVRGANCLNYSDHYSISNFESLHMVEVHFASFDRNGRVVEAWYTTDGPAIYIFSENNS